MFDGGAAARLELAVVNGAGVVGVKEVEGLADLLDLLLRQAGLLRLARGSTTHRHLVSALRHSAAARQACMLPIPVGEKRGRGVRAETGTPRAREEKEGPGTERREAGVMKRTLLTNA